MKKSLWATLMLLILAAPQSQALDITSLAPNRGTPGTLVAIDGGPFSPQAQAVIGEQYTTPRVVFENHLEFLVPNLPPGNYLLTVQDNTAVARQSFQFEVMAPTPEVSSLSPRMLDICSGDSQNQILVNGRNFLPGAVVLLNGNVVPSERQSSTAMEAQLMDFQKPGVYGVTVRNPDGGLSLPYSLSVNSVPEIYSIERGAEFVTYYEIIIHGKNFQFNSTLVLQEPGNSNSGQNDQQLSFTPRSSSSSEGGGTNIAPQRDRLIYVDCQTLIYRRYPSSFQGKELGLQIFNPDGGNTGLHYVNMP
jgi:hypothetical protein